jgi:hypothetical protein
MARLIAAALASVLGAAAGCTELGLSAEALGLAAGSPAPAVEAPAAAPGDLTVEVGEGNVVRVRLAAREVMRVDVPRGWRSAGVSADPRVCAAGAEGREAHAYHWAITRWERDGGAGVEIVVRTVGESDVYVEVNGREARLLPGAAVAVSDAPEPELRAVR